MSKRGERIEENYHPTDTSSGITESLESSYSLSDCALKVRKLKYEMITNTPYSIGKKVMKKFIVKNL